MLTLSAHAGHPRPPEGGPTIEPSGCRGRLGSPKSYPLTLVANTVDEYGRPWKGSRLTWNIVRDLNNIDRKRLNIW
eukprot:7803031-Pyramimonas_sp.AAC.1